jgi:2-dehydro-3-deoxyphosphooctonate aldolase (KDO 8-P synthase)
MVKPLLVIAGPCVMESEALVMQTAAMVRHLQDVLPIKAYFKSSFDKANRTSCHAFRGPGMAQGLTWLQNVKREYGLPVLTDVHEDTCIDTVASVVDVLQTPAFLCRQTNFIQRVARCGKTVNLKKGQFLSPQEMTYVVEKKRNPLATQTFGYVSVAHALDTTI